MPNVHACAPAPTPAPQLPSPCCIVTQAHPSSQYSLYCNTNLLPIKLYCNAVSSQASHLYCNTNLTSHNTILAFQPQYKTLYCNTISCSQDSFSAIQNPVLQYNFIPLKYNWAVAHFKSAQIFFFLITIIFFSLFISSNWKNHKNH